MSDAGDELLTIRQLAEWTGLAVGTLYRLSSEKRLPVVRLSCRCIRFRRRDIQRWIEELSDFPKDSKKGG